MKILSSVFDALSFLTVLPFPCPLNSDKAADRMGRALPWFPLAGALVGAAGGGAAWLGWNGWGQAIGAWFALAGMALITGGLHLDGFADTLDGLGSWKGKERALEIMKDSRIGGMGAIGLILFFGIYWSALREFSPKIWIAALASICALSRSCLVFSAQCFPYVPGREGIGRLVTDRREPAGLLIALVLGYAIAALCLNPLTAAILLACGLVVAGGLNLFFVRRLGGITGDTMGAVNQMVELSLMLALGISG